MDLARQAVHQAALDSLEQEAAERFPEARAVHLTYLEQFDGTMGIQIDSLVDEDGNEVAHGSSLRSQLRSFEDYEDVGRTFDARDEAPSPEYGEFSYTLTAPSSDDPATTTVTRRDRRATAWVDAQVEEVDRQARELNQRTFELGRDGSIAVVLSKFPDATEISVWNAGADDGEILFEVDEVRGPNGVCWSSQVDGGWENPFAEQLREYTVMTDRLGMEHLLQPADETHDRPWHGFVIR